MKSLLELYEEKVLEKIREYAPDINFPLSREKTTDSFLECKSPRQAALDYLRDNEHV